MLKGVLIASLALVGLNVTRVTAVDLEEARFGPKLQVVEMTGKLSISSVGKPQEELAQANLPLIRSGSVVQVISGRARFESDYNVEILAKAGDRFLFVSHEPDKMSPGSLHLAALGAPTGNMVVEAGGYRFWPGVGGALLIERSGRQELTIRMEGDVRSSVGDEKSGTLLSSTGVHGRDMGAGDSLIVYVPRAMEFQQKSGGRASFNIIQKKKALTFMVEPKRKTEKSQLSKEEKADRLIAKWPDDFRVVAEWVIEKYGAPDEIARQQLVWRGRGPWTKVVVYRQEGFHKSFLSMRRNILQQYIRYDVPKDKISYLAKADIDLSYDPQQKELSTFSDSEEANLLALNLGDEVVRGVKTPGQARDFYFKTLALSNAGKTSPYMEKLLFAQPNGGLPDYVRRDDSKD